MGARAAGAEMAAEPVPVRRPGVRERGVEGAEEGGEMSRVEQTGRTKTGLKLERGALVWVGGRKIMWRGTYRKASQRISIQDAQLETIMSPARGDQASLRGAPRLKEE